MRELRRETHRRAADWRAIDRMIWSDEFETAWNLASEAARAVVTVLVTRCDRSGIQSWIKSQRSIELDGKSLRELRILGRHHGVINYHSLSKDELVAELRGTE